MFGEEWKSRKERGVLPDGLADMDPGPELGSALASIDRARLNGHELVLVLQARSRQIAHLQAELYADMWDLAYTPPGYVDSPPERNELIDEFVADEIAAALTLSPRSADNQLSLAHGLSELRTVHEAFRNGRIDLTRARVFIRETGHLDPEEAREVVASLIDDAPDLTTGQLAARLRRRCLDRHPDRARRRYQEGIAERRVENHPNPDGTADLCTRQVPLDRAASIFNRINTLARQLQGQDDRSLDQIRADIVMDLLEGHSLHGSRSSGGVEIRVDLTTLLELDHKAGDIPGWGPVIADVARKVVESQRSGTWQATVTDPETGQPIWVGVTRRRPTADQRRHVIARNPTCVFPGCRRPALRSHIDHTVDHARGGPTAPHNLGPLCARHHLRDKHRAGWRLTQPRPGIFNWTSPRHHTYQVRPPPL